jgi:hypothetical protein
MLGTISIALTASIIFISFSIFSLVIDTYINIIDIWSGAEIRVVATRSGLTMPLLLLLLY